jgi:hypothetical protein
MRFTKFQCGIVGVLLGAVCIIGLLTAVVIFGFLPITTATTLPEEGKAQLMAEVTSMMVPNAPVQVQIEFLGNGNVLPQDKSEGVEQVLCMQLTIRPTQDNGRQSGIWGTTIAVRTGRLWTWHDLRHRATEAIRADWLAHNCPGEFHVIVQ